MRAGSPTTCTMIGARRRAGRPNSGCTTRASRSSQTASRSLAGWDICCSPMANCHTRCRCMAPTSSGSWESRSRSRNASSRRCSMTLASPISRRRCCTRRIACCRMSSGHRGKVRDHVFYAFVETWLKANKRTDIGEKRERMDDDHQHMIWYNKAVDRSAVQGRELGPIHRPLPAQQRQRRSGNPCDDALGRPRSLTLSVQSRLRSRLNEAAQPAQNRPS